MSSVFPFHDKDLALLPPPQVLEGIDYEQLLARRKNNVNALQPLLLDTSGKPTVMPATLVETDTESYWKIPLDAAAGLYYLDLESDPATRLLQADTYHELLFRQRVNESALATMPAFATGSDLDHIALRYGITRLTVTPATNTTPAVLETDGAFRVRMLLAIEGFARGGSQGWYLFNTLSASGKVKDAHVYSPTPCDITITVLSHDGDGTASAELLETVRTAIHDRHTRVLGDRITIRSAEVLHYSLSADVWMYPGPSSDTVLKAINTAFTRYRAQSERIGHWVAQSGVDAALHQPGVYRAVVTSPALPLQIATHQAPYCDGLTIREVHDGL
jgi:phage-related baseplate assembly protein